MTKPSPLLPGQTRVMLTAPLPLRDTHADSSVCAQRQSLLSKERNTGDEHFHFLCNHLSFLPSLAFQNILHIWFKGECAVSQSWSSDTNSSMCPTTCWCEDGGWRPGKSVLNRRTDATFVLWLPLTSFNLFLHSSWPADRWLHRIPPWGPGHCWYLISLCLFPPA